MSNYINKYLKYKNKYLLIKQLAGTYVAPVNIETEIYDMFNCCKVTIQLNSPITILEQLKS